MLVRTSFLLVRALNGSYERITCRKAPEKKWRARARNQAYPVPEFQDGVRGVSRETRSGGRAQQRRGSDPMGQDREQFGHAVRAVVRDPGRGRRQRDEQVRGGGVAGGAVR